ncbi:ABC transporter ATP-binding protein [Candidatus Falkowbacteria bacterium HGW-Falkowbacteria-2]|uniref:ABC transporter ATP-binding protein n=1 Tax=Candidatus Falkowbacteria bacterium HGW-Falkowbacteria-2 TaxID=2013769 RepID=A0A2N2E3X5_9BACT|nr:MAG: ABC transporter ATP-binding protein [Candidatus Falkowbacteria bacterium HGW-Falkowbacteria-2]
MSVIIKVDNLSVAYSERPAVAGVSFVINEGDYIGLAGPNGAGKTSLVKALLNLAPISTGKIELFGQDLSSFTQWDKIAYLPQERQHNPLFPASVLEVVASGLVNGKRGEAKAKARAILKELAIEEKESRLFTRLSGGQQQRVLLARALIREPQLLILDEPTTALDPVVREKFFAMLEKANREKNMAILMVTHDTADIGRYARSLLYLDEKLIFFGPFADFCHSPAMQDYFGDFAQHLICHQHHH